MHGLTRREIEVLRLVAEGQTDKEVAETLFISLNTAQNHVKSVREKLGVSSRNKAIVRAQKLGLL
jgi:DNA-binding CsgD family transcriptional regulator